MLDTLLKVLPPYVLLFAVFSVAGWLMEVALKYRQYHRFINRGYLIGPYCPIYGWGALLITLLANGVFFRKCTPVETFLVGFVACGALEYFISWYMEKSSHARWWDYSQKPLNLNGRIWIGNLILFGLAAVGIVYLADPPLFRLFDRMPAPALQIASGAFLVIVWTDRTVSHFLTRVLRDCIEHQQSDDTEEIRLEMHRMLKDRALLLRRISQAYPELQPRPSRLVERLKRARAEYRETARRLKAALSAAEAARADRRQQSSQEFLDALRNRVQQAKAAEQRARERLRGIENDVFNMRR